MATGFLLSNNMPKVTVKVDVKFDVAACLRAVAMIILAIVT